MSFSQELTKSTGRAIPIRESVTLKFTLRDKNNATIDLSAVTIGVVHVRLEPDGELLIDATISNGKMVVDPDQVANEGVLRVSFSGGAAGDTDRTPGMHLYDGFIVLDGDTKFIVRPQTKIEFEDIIAKV